NDDDPVYKMLVLDPSEDAEVLEVNWDKNPWFPEVLRKEMEHAYKTDPEKADHIWGGQTIKHSEAQILKGKWSYQSFEVNPSWDGPYYGLDFGFSNDPMFLVELYIDDATRKLYVRRENSQVGVEIPM